jgi:hypothetical protein
VKQRRGVVGLEDSNLLPLHRPNHPHGTYSVDFVILDYSATTGFAKIAYTINGKRKGKSRKWAGETARFHLELTPWYGCNRRPLRFHASTDCLQTEGSLHAPWALYKEDTAIYRRRRARILSSCSTQLQRSAPSSRLSSVLSSSTGGYGLGFSGSAMQH